MNKYYSGEQLGNYHKKRVRVFLDAKSRRLTMTPHPHTHPALMAKLSSAQDKTPPSLPPSQCSPCGIDGNYQVITLFSLW